ncbi:MAG: 4-oxalomesaconate tautomerase [Gammaproteobacteria bacterium]|jgi:4-oxalomesaconate tautomerase|nr:4-oxalomesaconate tautomerase [Gammaproteobacteria bacterium]MBT5204354.1 4-oxalomesaconate tautomerase [Gammaproteobacteria bacterium]MBT5601977.1 4-oxalomesaconate tautomerase [Gammaproteobacteria bacterium]
MTSQKAIPCSLYRGGTSKGLFFLEKDLPSDELERDGILLAVMGSPDERQIDGLGGAHPLTSKVAVIRKSKRADVDVDYLFLQVAVEKAEVTSNQNCGNVLAAVGPFAIEQGLVAIQGDTTDVRIHLDNTGALAVARIQTPGGTVNYAGITKIDGVPGSAAPVSIEFSGIEGSSCGALLPTGQLIDVIDGVDCTCIDNGMPVVLLRAIDFGLSGYETPEQLESDKALKSRLETIRLTVGGRMNLGDVRSKTVPKMCLVSPPRQGGLINTRTFIPHRVHEAIGVLGSVSVATACLIPGTVACEVADDVKTDGQPIPVYAVEHPTGFFSVEMQLQFSSSGQISVQRAALLRTSRLLMRGAVMIPETEMGQ